MKTNKYENQLDTDLTLYVERLLSEFASFLSLIIQDAVNNGLDNKLTKTNCDLDKSNTHSELITRKEALEYLKISAPTLHRYQKDGLVPYYKIGRKVYFKISELAIDAKTVSKIVNFRKGSKR